MPTDPTNGLAPMAIAATAGAVLSLLFNYVPGLNSRFDRLSADVQRAVMGLVVIVTAVCMALWQCADATASGLSYCGSDGLVNWRMILTNIVFALVGNQSTDRISPKPREDHPPKSALAREVFGPHESARAASDIPPRVTTPR